MDILLIANKADLKYRIFNKNLLELTLAQLDHAHTVRIYTPEKLISKSIKNKLLIARNEIDAISKFATNKANFIVITRLALTNINFDRLISYHNNHDKLLTLVAKNFVLNKSIPIYKLDAKKNVINVTRKRFADCGIYLFKGGITFKDYKDIFTVILDMIAKKKVKGFIHKGYWWTSYNIQNKNKYKGKNNDKFIDKG